jgi:hypothetical protein
MGAGSRHSLDARPLGNFGPLTGKEDGAKATRVRDSRIPARNSGVARLSAVAAVLA